METETMLQISQRSDADGTLIRAGQELYEQLTPAETDEYLRWIDAPSNSPNDKVSDPRQ